MNTYTISQGVMVIPKFPQVSLRIFWVLSLISVLTLLVFYILQVNAMIRESYLIQSYQRKIGETTQENQTLEIDFFQQNSLSNIEALVKNLNFERVDKIHYIRAEREQMVRASEKRQGSELPALESQVISK